CDLLLDVEAAPLLKHVMGGADLALPVPDPEGSGNADAADARELSRPQVTRDGLKALLEEEHGLLGRRVAERAMGRPANAAGEIEQHKIGAGAADLEAERVRAIRVERYGHRRLPDPTPLRLLLEHQTVGLELPDDHRDGLGRKSGQAGDFRLRQAAVPANERQ